MEIIGYVYGIRFNKCFAIEDKLGSIVDDILYNSNSKLNSDFFPEVFDNHNSKILINRQTGDKLTITPDNFVFEYTVKENSNTEFEFSLNSFDEIITRVFVEFHIKNINRFGFLIKSTKCQNVALFSEIVEVIKKHHPNNNPDSLSFRYNLTEKKPLKITKEFTTEDYLNEIISYDRRKHEADIDFFIDSQKYFVPSLNIIADSDISFKSFCNNSISKYKTKYLNEKK